MYGHGKFFWSYNWEREWNQWCCPGKKIISLKKGDDEKSKEIVAETVSKEEIIVFETGNNIVQT